MIAAPSTSREATLTGVATGLVGTLTAKVINPPAGTVVVAETTSNITEGPTGTYTWVFTTPSSAGQYLIVWDYGGSEDPVEELEVTYSASTAVSPAGSDLCTLAQVQEFIQKPATDDGQDAVIASLISRASRLIMDDCQREFAPAAGSASARTFRYEGGGYLGLAPYDVRSVTLVRIDVDESSPTTLGTDEWRLFPYPAPDGVFTALEISPSIVSSRARWASRLVEVTGLWGYASVPVAVQHACVLTVAEHLRRNVQAFSTVFKIDEGIIERPMSLPSAAWSALQPYRRMEYR